MGKPEQCVPSRASGGRRHVCQRTGIHGFPLQKGNLDETSDEPIIAMTDRLMTHRTCIDGCRGRLCRGKNLTQRRGSGLDRVETNSMITPIG
jgi:hypothetical protein